MYLEKTCNDDNDKRSQKREGGREGDDSERNAGKKQHTLPTDQKHRDKKDSWFFYSSTSESYTHKRSCHITIAPTARSGAQIFACRRSVSPFLSFF